MNKNILMVCYYYPPLSDVGAKRSVAFSKYFKEYGWNPLVLSVRNPDRAYCSVGNDLPPQGIHTEYSYSVFNVFKLVSRANAAIVRLVRLFSINVKRNYLYEIFCVPDHFIGWIPLTVLKGWHLIRKYDIDIIYVSCTPFSAGLIGVLLKWLSGKPLILDYRDPYGLEVVFSILGLPEFRRRINRFIDGKLIKHADIFIVTTEETRKAYIGHYPEIRDKIFTIHNGFDSVDAIQGNGDKHTKFTIVYTGEFYSYGNKSKAFFEAIALLKKKGEISCDDFQFLFFGEGKNYIDRIAKDCNVSDLVSANVRIPYKEVVDVIKKSHLQLLRILKPMISTKLYEGIPLNVPFLATIPKGEVEDIIKRFSPSSYIVTEESPEQVAEAILAARTKYANGGIKDNDVQGFLESFSRENLTLKLMNIIETRLGK